MACWQSGPDSSVPVLPERSPATSHPFPNSSPPRLGQELMRQSPLEYVCRQVTPLIAAEWHTAMIHESGIVSSGAGMFRRHPVQTITNGWSRMEHKESMGEHKTNTSIAGCPGKPYSVKRIGKSAPQTGSKGDSTRIRVLFGRLNSRILVAGRRDGSTRVELAHTPRS
jgi:hypothetical protein